MIGLVGLILRLEEAITLFFGPFLIGDIHADADTPPTPRCQRFDPDHFTHPAPFAIGSEATEQICISLPAAAQGLRSVGIHNWVVFREACARRCLCVGLARGLMNRKKLLRRCLVRYLYTPL
jgi:hypothetical protein